MFELFRISFLSFTFLDFIDIVLVSYIIYRLFIVIRGTIAAQIFFGLIIVLLLSFITQAADLKALGWLLKLVSDIWVIAFIILFQPEIRRLLLMLGRYSIFTGEMKGPESSVIDILVETSFELSKFQHGALMVLVKTGGIKTVIETGEEMNSQVSTALLRSIFFPRSPLHDGAVIIKGDIIEAARCTLPLSQTNSVGGISLGMRHKAGLGISEQAEVISIIVSEETGLISIAENGVLTRGLSKDSLRKMLTEKLQNVQKVKSWKNLFEAISKQK